MSDSEGFLTRWSRRKRQAEERADEPAADVPAPLRSGQPSAEGAPRDADAPPRAEGAVPAVDLTKLPSLESITAATDIRDFLAAGVPEALKRAALRRAWAADPAIRDFVGLAENAWDFTAPDGVPGFGPMLPTDDVARMAERITRNVDLSELRAPEADASPRLESSARETSTVDDNPHDNPPPPETTKSHILDESNPPVTSVSVNQNSPSGDKVIDIAAQNDSASDPQPVRRGHGGAVPQ